MPHTKNKFNPRLMHKPFYPFSERYFYRPIASIVTIHLAQFHSSPTVVNFVGFGIGLIGIGCVASTDYRIRVLGAGLLIFSYILDCVDGQLARGFKMVNRFGTLLDTTLDSIKESLIFFALAWTYYWQSHDPNILWYLIGILFLQRMFGRTLAWYRLLYDAQIEVIKGKSLKKIPLFLRPVAIFFSESYRSGTIWLVVFVGILTDQIIATFCYFIGVVFFLFIYLLTNAYLQRQDA